MDENIKKYLHAICDRKIFKRGGNHGTPPKFQFYLKYLFKNVDPTGLRVLDIGAGTGIFSLYLSILGAKSITALEPELDGSSKAMVETFKSLAEELGINNIKIEKEVFQKTNFEDGSFDLILLHNSINHLEEEACTHLKTDKACKAVYLNLFKKMNKLLSADGLVIMADATRYNFYDALHMSNPFCPGIGWEVHQSPFMWGKLMEQCGFNKSRINWTSISQFGEIGRLFLSNVIASYFLMSHFSMVTQKSA